MAINPWTQFLDLIPTKSRWVGKVTATHGLGKLVVDLPNSVGDNIVVNGDSSTYSSGDYVFIEGDTIVAKSQNLKLPVGNGMVV